MTTPYPGKALYHPYNPVVDGVTIPNKPLNMIQTGQMYKKDIFCLVKCLNLFNTFSHYQKGFDCHVEDNQWRIQDFPLGWGRRPIWGGDLRRECFSAKMYVKTRESDPVGVG